MVQQVVNAKISIGVLIASTVHPNIREAVQVHVKTDTLVLGAIFFARVVQRMMPRVFCIDSLVVLITIL